MIYTLSWSFFVENMIKNKVLIAISKCFCKKVEYKHINKNKALLAHFGNDFWPLICNIPWISKTG